MLLAVAAAGLASRMQYELLPPSEATERSTVDDAVEMEGIGVGQ